MKRQVGFTLIELVITILLTSILAVYAIINYPSSLGQAASLEQLKRDIRITQLLAMSENAPYTITLSSTGYTISPAPPHLPATMIWASGITTSPTSLVITFDENGRPTAGAGATITIGSQTITVLAVTGFVS